MVPDLLLRINGRYTKLLRLQSVTSQMNRNIKK